MPEQNKDVVEYLDFSIGDGDGTVEYLDFDLSEQQQAAPVSKTKQSTTASPKASVTKPPTPMQGENKVDAALREAEAETAQEGYSTPKEPSPETLTRFDEKPLPTFWDSPFIVPGAGMVKAQELNQKLKIADKQIKALQIKAQAGTLTEQERQQGLKTIEEASKTQELRDAEIEFYNLGMQSEIKKNREAKVTTPLQGDMERIVVDDVSTLKRSKNDSYWSPKRGGWWYDETTPAPDTASGNFNPPVVNEDNILNQARIESVGKVDIVKAGILSSIFGNTSTIAARGVLSKPSDDSVVQEKLAKLNEWLSNPVNQTTWVERNGKKMLIRVGDGAERIQDGPQGEGFYRTEIHGTRKDGKPDKRLVKVDEVLDPYFSRDAIKQRREFRNEEVERELSSGTEWHTQTKKFAVSVVKGATGLVGAEGLTRELGQLQDTYDAVLERDLEFTDDVWTERVGAKTGKVAQWLARSSDAAGNSIAEMLPSLAAGAPLGAIAEANVLARIAMPVTKIGKLGTWAAGKVAYGIVEGIPETVMMVNADRWELEDRLIDEGYSRQTAHRIANENAGRLAAQNMLLQGTLALNPFGIDNMISKGLKGTFKQGVGEVMGTALKQTEEELLEQTQKLSFRQLAGKTAITTLTESHLEEQPQTAFEEAFKNPFDVEHTGFFKATGNALRQAYMTREGWKAGFDAYLTSGLMGGAIHYGQGRSITEQNKRLLDNKASSLVIPEFIPGKTEVERKEALVGATTQMLGSLHNELSKSSAVQEAAKRKQVDIRTMMVSDSVLDKFRAKGIESLIKKVGETGDITGIDERVAIAMNPVMLAGKSGQEYVEHAGAATEFFFTARAANADGSMLAAQASELRSINDKVEQATARHLEAVESAQHADLSAVNTKEHRRKIALVESTKHDVRVAALEATKQIRELQPVWLGSIRESVKQAKEDLLNPFGNEAETALQGEEELDVTLPTPEEIQKPVEAPVPVSDEPRFNEETGVFAKSGYEGNLPDTDVRSIYEERMTALNQELDALVNADEGLLEDTEASQILNELPIDLADLTEREYKGNLQPESRLKYGTREYQDARSIIETKLNRIKDIAASRQGEVDGQGSQTDQNEVAGANVSQGVTSDASKDRLPIKIGEYGRIEIADAKKELADWIKVNDFTDEASGATASPTIVTTETLKDNCSLVSLDNGTKAFVGVSPNGLGIDMFVFGDSMGKEAYSVNIGFAGEATTSDRVYVDYILSKSRATGKIVNAGSSGMGALCYSTVAKIINASLPNVKILDGLIAARASFIARSRFKGSKFIIETSHLETPIDSLVDMQLLDKFDATTKSRLAHIYNKLGFHNDLKLTKKEKASLLEEYKKIMSGAVVKRSIVTNPVRLKAHLLSGSDNAYYAVASKALPWEKNARRERFHAKVRNRVKTEVILPGQKKSEANVVAEPKAVESANPIETPKAKVDTTKPVKEQLKTMLLNTGLYTEEDAVATAEVCGRVTESLANALGVDPIEFFNEYGIKVVVDEELDGASNQDKRGSIVFGNKEIKISLLEDMDKSTFLHEFGHFMLEAMGDIVDSGKGSDQIKKDYAVLLRFLGAKNRSDINTPQHEKFARALEKYLGQGKAPVKELEGIFKMFSKWFTAIYKTLSALDVRLSNDVKKVFDRLVAPEASVRGGKFTEKFKQWFGNSKVVDKNGNPLVVIHGTRSPEIKDGKFSVSEDVMQSDPGFRGRGIYLAPKEGSDTSKGKYGPNIYPFYVRIEKPLIWKQENIYEQLARYIKTNGSGEYDMSKSIMDKLVSIGKEEGLSNYLEGFKLPGDLTKLLKEEGYDGVIREKDGSVEEYVVFSPGQIKSALVNTGEYSRKDERVFAQSPVTKVTVDGKTHEVTDPDKIASFTAAKSNADALQDGVRQNTELSKEEKHDLHIQVGNAHRDYKKAVIENERINRVPTNISDALGVKGIDWFYATTDTYLKAIKNAGVKNAEGLRKLLKSKGLAPMAVDTGVALFESFNTFGDKGSNPVAGVEANASAKKDTSKQIEVAAKGSVVIANVLVPENAEKAIKESGVKPETEKSVSEIKNNPKAFGSILHAFANRAVFALLDSRMSNLSKRVKAFVADMVATKNKFAETYQVMSEVKGVDNKRLGFMLGWTTVNERQLTKDEFHKMYPQSPDKVYDAYSSALDAMKVGRDTILDAAKNMNDQVMKRLEARQGVLLDRFTELQDQIEEANKEGKSGSKEMIELKNKLRGEELSRTRVENQIEEQKASYKELVDILSKREFYWPLSRFGKFKVEVKDKKTGERVGIFFMEDKSEASKAKLLEDIKLQALADAALGDAFKNDRLSVGSPLELVDLSDDITGQSPFNVDGAMLSFLDAAQKISEDTKGELEAAVMSAKAMETLKNHMKERKGIPGWSTDAFKVFDTYIHSLSSNVANMKHSLLMDDELKKFTQENAGEAYDSKLHATARGFVEHAKRPPDHKWVNTVLGAGFVMHIGARASFAVAQLGQLAGSVYPALGQFYGYINAMQAITAALPIAIGTVGWTQIDKFELITKENVTKWVNDRMSPSAFRMASSDPKVREHIATVCKEMVIRAADSGSLQAAPTFGFADNIIKSAGEQIASKAGVIALKFEQINRLTTLISWGILNATQGEVKLSDSTGFIKEATASTQEKIASGDKATIDNIYDVGETVNELSNYIRGRGNQPKYLRYRGGVGAALRLAFNYKSFPIGWLAQFHALGLLSARKAGGGKFKQTLAYARPQLVGMGVQALMAGPKGIMYFKLLEMLLSAFDEPEEWMLNFFEEVSKELYKVIRKGMKAVGMDPDKNKELAIYMHHACINGLPTASGIDPSAMFEGDLVTVKGSTPETVGNFLMGATGSSFAAAIDKTFKTGSIVDGMKMLTPSAIKGPVEAITGETSIGGGKVELTKFGRAARALGFQPTSVQIQRDALNTKFKVQSFVRSQGKEFATEFAKFYGGGKNPDNESIEELKKEVKAFNARNKELLEKYNVRGVSASEIMLQARSARKNLKVSDRIVQEGVSAKDEE